MNKSQNIFAVHYIEDFGKFVKDVYSLLNDGGHFIFSQEHPLTTAPIAGASWSRNPEGTYSIIT